MNRKLLVLNIALAAAVVWAVVAVRGQWRAEKAREAGVLSRKPNPSTAPPYTPLPQPPAAMPSAYAGIAQKTLFDRSRDSTVVVEAAPAPAPKPMPALPLYYGQMNLGDGPTVMLSEAASAPLRGIKVGEQVGEFKLVDANSRELAFEWEGKVVRKSVDELLDRGGATPGADASARAARSTPSATATAAAQQPKKIDPNGSCNPNDGNPAGAIVDGFRKVVNPSPFGPICYWDPVKQ